VGSFAGGGFNGGPGEPLNPDSQMTKDGETPVPAPASPEESTASFGVI